MADRMQATALVTRRRDEQDARLVRLYLIDHGRALRAPILADLAERATATLAERERRTLETALTKIIANLEPVAPIAEAEPDE
jgi:DNA-binding MarR family transcriptional regulator